MDKEKAKKQTAFGEVFITLYNMATKSEAHYECMKEYLGEATVWSIMATADAVLKNKEDENN